MSVPKNHLLYSDITYKLQGCLFTVYNELGYGHKEQVYQNALEKELILNNIPYKREITLDVLYKGEKIGNYRPDFLVEEKIVVELKALEFVPKKFEKQLINYLKSTGFYMGFLVNFGSERIYIKRLIWTKTI